MRLFSYSLNCPSVVWYTVRLSVGSYIYSICLYICISMSVCQCLPVSLSVLLSICLSVYLNNICLAEVLLFLPPVSEPLVCPSACFTFRLICSMHAQVVIPICTWRIITLSWRSVFVVFLTYLPCSFFSPIPCLHLLPAQRPPVFPGCSSCPSCLLCSELTCLQPS
jgi:hypothetical protein